MTLIPPPSFIESAAALGVAFDDGDVDRLGRFLDLVRAANAKFNLTTVTEPDAMWSKHVADSLTLMPYIVSVEAERVIDVGSGAGFPGIPLAIAMRGAHFTLVDATGKKTRFLEESAAALALGNVTVVQSRAEDLGRDRDGHRGRYDVVTARAVGRLPVLLELTVPLARIGGLVLAIKGAQATAEIDEAKAALHCLHATVIAVDRTASGTIVVIEKRRETPKIYPRRPGEPKRNPL